MDTRKIDPAKAEQVTRLTMEIQDLRFDLKQYVAGSREAIKERETKIKKLTEQIDQPELL